MRQITLLIKKRLACLILVQAVWAQLVHSDDVNGCLSQHVPYESLATILKSGESTQSSENHYAGATSVFT